MYKTQFVGESILASGNSKKGRVWRGSTNLYGTYKWLGAKRKAIDSVSDLKTWTKFWSSEEETSLERAVGFEVSRPDGAFSHSVRAQHWDLPARLNIPRNRYGVESSIVGPGQGYSRFRESILYNHESILYNRWIRSRAVAAK